MLARLVIACECPCQAPAIQSFGICDPTVTASCDWCVPGDVPRVSPTSLFAVIACWGALSVSMGGTGKIMIYAAGPAVAIEALFACGDVVVWLEVSSCLVGDILTSLSVREWFTRQQRQTPLAH